MRQALLSFPTLPALILSAMLAGIGAHADVIERIVAIVNDDVITLSDMEKFSDRLRGGGLTDDLLIPDEATKQDVLKNREKLLQKMIDEKIIDSEVKRQSLSVPIERVEQEIRSIAKRNNVSRDDLKAALKERGIDFAQYQNFIKTGLERQSLIEKAVTSRIKITEDDVLAAYQAQTQNTEGQAFEYTLSHIYFQAAKDKGGAPAAHARAEAVLKKLKDGTAFEKLASEASEDPAFETGGMLGVFKPGELNRDLEQNVQKLGVGENTGVLPTQGGFHIVKLVRKRLISDPRTEGAREKIRAELYERVYKKQFQSWLEQLRQDAFVRINPK